MQLVEILNDIKTDVEKGYFPAAQNKLDKIIKTLETDWVAIALCALIEKDIKRVQEEEESVDVVFKMLESLKLFLLGKKLTVALEDKENEIYIDQKASKELDLPYFNDAEKNIHIRNARNIWFTKVVSWGHNWDEHHVKLLKPLADASESVQLRSLRRPGWWRIMR